MVIEFNGLPGTGKTTVAHSLKEILDSEYIVQLKYCCERPRLIRYASYFFDGSAKLYVLAYKYTRRATKQYKKSNLKYIGILIAYYRAYRSFLKTKKDEVLIVDQGILQALISIHHDTYIVDSKYLKRIFQFLYKKNIHITVVNCESNTQLSFQRIKSRNTDGGRLDVCDDAERKRILKIQEQNFMIVRAACASIMKNSVQLDINTIELPYENALKILDCLKLKRGC